MRTLPCLLLVAACIASPALAFAADPAAARAQLEVGYSLKGQGKFAEALPHLLESLRLDPQLKTLTNLADCEEHLGKLVDAQQHWLMARDRAGIEQNDKFKAAAEARLSALESRMPKLTIRLAPDATPSTEVVRDGTTLGPISLGTPLPTNVGAHTVVARAPGMAEKSFTVTLAEGEQKELVVGPGGPLPPSALTVPADTSQAQAEALPAGSTWNNQKTAAAVAAGVAVVGVGLGVGFGVSTGSHWSSARHDCGAGCGPSSPAQAERNTALTDATASDASFIVAGVALAGAVVLWVTAPKVRREAPRALDALRIAPAIGRRSGGMAVLGRF